MPSLYEVGATFKITDQASVVLKKIADQFRALQKLIVDTQLEIDEFARPIRAPAGLFASIERQLKAVATQAGATRKAVVGEFDKPFATPGFTTSLDALKAKIADLGVEAKAAGTDIGVSLNAAVFDPAVIATAAIANNLRAAVAAAGALGRRMGAAAAIALPGPAGGAGAGGGGGRGGGRGGLLGGGGIGGGHFGRVGVPIPGTGHYSMPGTPMLALAGLAGYGVYLESEFEDQAARMLLTGQVKTPEGMTKSKSFDLVRKTLQNISSSTGFSPKDAGEAMLTVERQFGGLPFEKRVEIEETLAPFAASEARLKETGFKEAFEALVGLAHMTGTYDPKKLPELARAFSYSSLITPSTITQLQTALSYSMPMLHAGLDMDPATITFLTAMAQTAGIKSTKSGTWIRSFFENAEPSVGTSETAKHHNDALKKMGLLGDNNLPNWRVDGADGKVDWDKSIVSLSEKISAFIKATPVDQRLGILKQAFGERGGGFASLMNLEEFIKQFPVLQDKMRNFKGGDDALQYLTENSPVQKFRQALADTQILLMDIGQVALPLVNGFLKDLDEGLKKSKEQFDSFIGFMTKLFGLFSSSGLPKSLNAPSDGDPLMLNSPYMGMFAPMAYHPGEGGSEFGSNRFADFVNAGTQQGVLDGLIAISGSAKQIVSSWFSGGGSSGGGGGYSGGGGGGRHRAGRGRAGMFYQSGGGGAASLGPHPGEALDKARWLVAEMQSDFGLTKDQASGAVGWMFAESASTLSPSIRGPGGDTGWAQWVGNRRSELLARGPLSDATNYAQLKYELLGKYRGTLDRLRQAKSWQEALHIWGEGFEGAAGTPGGMEGEYRKHFSSGAKVQGLPPWTGGDLHKFAQPHRPATPTPVHETIIKLDGKVVARSTSRHLAALGTHPTRAARSDPGKGFTTQDYGFATG